MNETLKGTIDRAVVSIISSLLTWAVMRGWLPSDLVKELGPTLPILVSAAVGTAIAYVVNRPKALAIAAEKAGAVVLTSPQIAEDTPSHENILPLDATKKEIDEAVKNVARRDANN